MVDNSAFVFGLNIDNGVPIIPFYDCKEDDELVQLEGYLMSLRHRDIRKANQKAFHLASYSTRSTLKDIVTSIYQVHN